MNDLQFKQLLSEYLAPMLGATLTGSTASTPREKLVAYYQAPNQIAIKLTKGSTSRFILKRDRKFEEEESRLAEDFLGVVNIISEAGDRAYFGELVRALPRWVIARHLKQETTLAAILEQLDSWSSETYEGRRITCALGLMQNPSNTGVMLSEYWSNSYAPVLSNGYDTILEIGSDGQLAGLNCLAASGPSGFAPFRLSSIADWSKEDGRLAATLNTQGEILLFKGGELRFARRAGKWTHVVHMNAVQIMNPYGSKELRTEIYKSCLDASFARTGACIAVVAKENLPKVANIVSTIDRIKGGSSYKSRFLSLSLDRSFNKIERPLRQELLALDGACVLDYQGNILAVGAIVTVPSGSPNGGGRRAAAVALSELGVAIKVSADGPISIFKGANDKPLLGIF